MLRRNVVLNTHMNRKEIMQVNKYPTEDLHTKLKNNSLIK